MVEINFFSDSKLDALYPLNLGRCISSLNYGGRSIRTQWKEAMDGVQYKRIRLNSRLLPSSTSINAILKLRSGEQWIHEGILIAEIEGISEPKVAHNSILPDLLNSAADLFEKCGEGIAEDLDRIKLSWRTGTLEEEEREAWARVGVFIHGPLDKIHIAPGAQIRSCSLNTEGGDIILGQDSEVMEGCRIRGPFILGEKSQLKMGALIYGPSSVGSDCRIGGEISNSVFHDYSNKAHGGFVGNSVIGSWCNLGAETSTSNLKNNYSEIKVWDNEGGEFEKSGRMFCGLLMGDHSKTAIHTAFNSGTTVGAFCNVFCSSTPLKHIESFTWGGSESSEAYDIEKAIDTARKVMLRRGVEMSQENELNARELYKSSRFGIK